MRHAIGVVAIAGASVIGLAFPGLAQTNQNCSITTENTALLADYPTVRAFYDAINTNTPDLLDCALASTWLPEGAPEGTPRGPSSMKAEIAGMAMVFSTLELTTQEVVAQGNTVVVRNLIRVVQAAPMLGLGAAGAEGVFMAIDIHHLGPDGLIVENFGAEDFLEYFVAIGALP